MYKNISDHRKEKMIFFYSKLLLINSIKIILIIILILIYLYALDFFSKNFFSLITSVLGIIELCIFSITYHQLRKKIYAKL